MSLSIGTVAVALLLCAGLLAIGMEAYRQNRPLIQAFGSGNRKFKSVLWRALVVWSPMAVLIVLLLGVASAISQGMTQLAYRYTTLDEFCAVQGLDSPVYVACTGMGKELHSDKIKQLDAGKDLEQQIFRRYSVARKRILETPISQLSAQAKNRSAFMSTFSPSAVLALPPGSEDDPVLTGLVTERRRLFESPVPKPADLVELMSYRQSVDTRNRLLSEMDAKIETRKIALYLAEYGRLTPAQRLEHQRRNRILLLLGRVKVDVDQDVQAALAAPSSKAAANNTDLIKQGLIRALAHSERDAQDIFSRELVTPARKMAAYDVLSTVPRCTVAEENTALRLNSNDFRPFLSNLGDADPSTFTSINGGSFPCFGKPGASGSWKLVSVGFRKSVLLSIDRMRDEAAVSAFRNLAMLERKTESGAVDTETATHAIANLVPDIIPLGRQKCGLFHPANCVMNGMAGSAEAAYARSRTELVDQYNGQTNKLVNIADLTIQQKIDHARVTTDAEISRMHAAGYATAKSIFSLNDLLRIFGWIGLLLIALRSFLYVLALELFDRNGELRISFDVENPVEGNYVAGSEITIDGDFPFPIINRGSLTNTLADIEFAPWRWSAPIARIMHGRYFLFNRSVFSPSRQKGGAEEVRGMEASARGAYSIVEWRMQPGEEVIFNYANFYGASTNVQLKTDISLRLSTLLLGKVFFHYARCISGEGRLLLEARIHNTPRDSMSSIKPTRLVAWNRHAQFSADSHRQPWKTLINPYTIVRESTPGVVKGLVIIAPESESASFFGMGIQFVKRIFSRIF